MGVDINTHRCRIGLFGAGCGSDVVGCTIYVHLSYTLKYIGSVCFISLLLLQAGIEPNPGPGSGRGTRLTKPNVMFAEVKQNDILEQSRTEENSDIMMNHVVTSPSLRTNERFFSHSPTNNFIGSVKREKIDIFSDKLDANAMDDADQGLLSIRHMFRPSDNADSGVGSLGSDIDDDTIMNEGQGLNLFEDKQADDSYDSDYEENMQSKIIPSVSRNIIDLTQQMLYHHRRKVNFVKTRALQEVKSLVKETGIAVICGSHGTGKTSIALEIMQQQQSKRITLVKIHNPVEWQLVVNIHKQYVVLIDDMFGKTDFKETLLDQWLPLFDSMYTVVKKRQCILIITSRTHILQEAIKYIPRSKFATQFLLCDLCRVDLNLKYPLTAIEKRIMILGELNKKGSDTAISPNLITNNLTSKEISRIVKIDTFPGFPQLLSFYSSDMSYRRDPVAFFESPNVYTLEAIDMLYLRDRIKYVTLVSIVLNNNSFQTDDKTCPRVIKLFQDVAEYCDIQYTKGHFMKVKDAIECINGVYLKYEAAENIYTISHTAISVATCVSFGKKCPQFTLQNCTEDFICKYVTLDEPEDVKHFISLPIHKEDYNILLERVSEMLMTDVSSVSILKILNNPVFVNLLFRHLFNNNKLNHFIKKTVHDPLSRKSSTALFFCANKYLVLSFLLKQKLVQKEKDHLNAELMKTLKKSLEFGNKDSFCLLLDFGVKVTEGCLLSAVKSNQTRIVDCIHNEFQWSSEELSDALLLSCENGNEEMVQQILKFGQPLNENCLMKAVESENTNLVKTLLSKGSWSREVYLLSIKKAKDMESSQMLTLLNHNPFFAHTQSLVCLGVSELSGNGLTIYPDGRTVGTQTGGSGGPPNQMSLDDVACRKSESIAYGSTMIVDTVMETDIITEKESKDADSEKDLLDYDSDTEKMETDEKYNIRYSGNTTASIQPFISNRINVYKLKIEPRAFPRLRIMQTGLKMKLENTELMNTMGYKKDEIQNIWGDSILNIVSTRNPEEVEEKAFLQDESGICQHGTFSLEEEYPYICRNKQSGEAFASIFLLDVNIPKKGSLKNEAVSLSEEAVKILQTAQTYFTKEDLSNYIFALANSDIENFDPVEENGMLRTASEKISKQLSCKIESFNVFFLNDFGLPQRISRILEKEIEKSVNRISSSPYSDRTVTELEKEYEKLKSRLDEDIPHEVQIVLSRFSEVNGFSIVDDELQVFVLEDTNDVRTQIQNTLKPFGFKIHFQEELNSNEIDWFLYQGCGVLCKRNDITTQGTVGGMGFVQDEHRVMFTCEHVAKEGFDIHNLNNTIIGRSLMTVAETQETIVDAVVDFAAIRVSEEVDKNCIFSLMDPDCCSVQALVATDYRDLKDKELYKHGSRTGMTKGKYSEEYYTKPKSPGFKRHALQRMYLVESQVANGDNATIFADHGDSGSLVCWYNPILKKAEAVFFLMGRHRATGKYACFRVTDGLDALSHKYNSSFSFLDYDSFIDIQKYGRINIDNPNS